MLFQVLLTRICGGKHTAFSVMEQRGHYERAINGRYPQLVILVRELLQTTVKEQTRYGKISVDRRIQLAFPALEIIERVGIPIDDIPEVRRLLLKLLSSASWELRDKVARGLSTLDSPLCIKDELKRWGLDKAWSQNMVHGALLCLKYSCQTKKINDERELSDLKSL